LIEILEGLFYLTLCIFFIYIIYAFVIGDACEWCFVDIDGDGRVYPSDAMIFLMEWKSKNCPGLP